MCCSGVRFVRWRAVVGVSGVRQCCGAVSILSLPWSPGLAGTVVCAYGCFPAVSFNTQCFHTSRRQHKAFAVAICCSCQTCDWKLREGRASHPWLPTLTAVDNHHSQQTLAYLSYAYPIAGFCSGQLDCSDVRPCPSSYGGLADPRGAAVHLPGCCCRGSTSGLGSSKECDIIRIYQDNMFVVLSSQQRSSSMAEHSCY
jgi:hypothetical protein